METNRLYEYILTKYGRNVPIMSEDFDGNVEDELELLCKKDLLMKFDEGIYYIPTETVFGKSLLNFDEVIERRYISNGLEIYGYYGETALLNRIGVSTQVVAVPTIYTNCEEKEKRIVKLANRSIILRKPRIPINVENVVYLIFLEIITEMPLYYFEDEYKRRCVVEYISRNNITKENLFRYAKLFPGKTLRKLTESGLVIEQQQRIEIGEPNPPRTPPDGQDTEQIVIS